MDGRSWASHGSARADQPTGPKSITAIFALAPYIFSIPLFSILIEIFSGAILYGQLQASHEPSTQPIWSAASPIDERYVDMAQQPIVILGAGLAGLTLGRCLHQKGIPAILLEKMTSSPRYSYGITLRPQSFKSLLQVLQIDEMTFRQKLAVDANRGGAGKVHKRSLVPQGELAEGAFRCHRGRLEMLLREGQDIRWDHKVQDVELCESGIQMLLAGEDRMETQVLIGTDGVHSQLRRSLAPDIELKVLPFVVFNGKRRMTIDEFRMILEPEMKDDTIIDILRDDKVLEISISDVSTTSIELSYTYSRPARLVGDPLHRPERAIAAATDIPEAFYKELDELGDLSKAFSKVFSSSQVRHDRVLHWLMRKALGGASEVHELAQRGVVMIGDTVHAVPILGGEGANVAMEDGIQLAEYIAQEGTDNFHGFVTSRYGRWNRAVAASEERLVNMHSPNRSSL